MSTRTGKGKKRKRIGRLKDKGQSAQFMKAAKELGLVNSGQSFEDVMKALLKSRKRGSS